MKRILSLTVAAILFSVLPILLILLLLSPVFALEPATITYTNFRGRASIELATTAKYWQNDTIRFTNMVAYSGTSTNSAREDLTACQVTVVAGDSTTNRTYTGTVMNATAGTWKCEAIVLPVNPCYFQNTLLQTNTGTNYTYWTDKVETGEKLGQ